MYLILKYITFLTNVNGVVLAGRDATEFKNRATWSIRFQPGTDIIS